MTSGPVKVALTVAGSDPTGGAGIQADLKTFAALGVWGTSVIATVTVQDSEGVSSVFSIPADVVRAQIDAVVSDLPPAAMKTGAVGTAASVDAIADAVEAHQLSTLVVDPVLAASRGAALLDPDAVPRMKGRLLPLCTLLTPNLDEASVLLGRPVRSRTDMAAAAEELAALGPDAVLLKGGHLEGDDAADVLWNDGRALWMETARISPNDVHGTGCILSAAITAELALGTPLQGACEGAKALLTSAIGSSRRLGRGSAFADPNRSQSSLS